MLPGHALFTIPFESRYPTPSKIFEKLSVMADWQDKVRNRNAAEQQLDDEFAADMLTTAIHSPLICKRP